MDLFEIAKLKHPKLGNAGSVAPNETLAAIPRATGNLGKCADPLIARRKNSWKAI